MAIHSTSLHTNTTHNRGQEYHTGKSDSHEPFIIALSQFPARVRFNVVLPFDIDVDFERDDYGVLQNTAETAGRNYPVINPDEESGRAWQLVSFERSESSVRCPLLTTTTLRVAYASALADRLEMRVKKHPSSKYGVHDF